MGGLVETAGAPRDVRVALESPRQPEVLALIEALDEHQRPLYPAESHHGIDLEALCAPGVLFAVARDADGAALGCGAIVCSGTLGEVKRMFTVPAARGRGVARALLERLEAEARAAGCSTLALETGHLQPEAIGLYTRLGYRLCDPFGGYRPDPYSAFMCKPAPTGPVRLAGLFDLPRLAPLFDLYRQFYGQAPDAQAALDFLAQRQRARQSQLLLAETAAGEAAGFVQLYPLFCSIAARPILLLSDLFVLPAQRRSGLGRALLRAAEDLARRQGCARLELSTAHANTPAQRLYESLGWVRDEVYRVYTRELGC